jgi:hypothetical protein
MRRLCGRRWIGRICRKLPEWTGWVPEDGLVQSASEGSGANGLHEQTPLAAPCRRHAPSTAFQPARSQALNAQTCQSKQSFADAMHQLDAADRNRRIPEPLEA